MPRIISEGLGVIILGIYLIGIGAKKTRSRYAHSLCQKSLNSVSNYPHCNFFATEEDSLVAVETLGGIH